MAKRRRDRWATGPPVSLPEAAYGGPVYDLAEPDPVLAWVTFPDRVLEVEARVLAHTERAVLVEWGFGQGADCAWVWRDAISLAGAGERVLFHGVSEGLAPPCERPSHPALGLRAASGRRAQLGSAILPP